MLLACIFRGDFPVDIGVSGVTVGVFSEWIFFEPQAIRFRKRCDRDEPQLNISASF